MESPQHLKSRIQAVENIGKITKAMEVVAATKMRRSQEIALSSRDYAFSALRVLETLIAYTSLDILHQSPFLNPREIKNTLLVVVTSDRGLAGAFNMQVLRTAERLLKEDTHAHSAQHTYKALLVGKKAHSFAKRTGIAVVGTYTGHGEYVSLADVGPLVQQVQEGFLSGAWDRVVVVSTNFRTALQQDVVVRELLPVHLDMLRKTVEEIIPEHGKFAHFRVPVIRPDGAQIEYLLEPSPEKIISELVPHLIRMQIYHVLLEANASEHSARRVAMKKASDNAHELKDDLTLEFNKARQAGITTQIIEITSTQSALS